MLKIMMLATSVGLLLAFQSPLPHQHRTSVHTMCGLEHPARTAAGLRQRQPSLGRAAHIGMAAAAAASQQPDGVANYGLHIKIKGQILNWFGAIYVIQALALGVVWSATMLLLWATSKITGWDAKRKWYDFTGKLWSRLNMWLGGCSPRVVSGLEHLPKEGEAALLVANHASWFDIPLLGQAIPNTFKFIASKPLGKLPLVGQQLRGGKHILIDRASRKGQLQSFRDSIAWLKKGVCVCAFPEGTRTKTGRVGKFKGGVFSMATKTGSPVVPISVVGTFNAYPPWVLLPLKPAVRVLVDAFCFLFGHDNSSPRAANPLLHSHICSCSPCVRTADVWGCISSSLARSLALSSDLSLCALCSAVSRCTSTLHCTWRGGARKSWSS